MNQLHVDTNHQIASYSKSWNLFVVLLQQIIELHDVLSGFEFQFNAMDVFFNFYYIVVFNEFVNISLKCIPLLSVDVSDSQYKLFS
jgi:hypothetical protein